MDLKDLGIIAGDPMRHWYYSSKAAAMKQYVSGAPVRRILDVGAGSGIFSQYLLANSNAETATCVDIGYEADTEETCAGKPIRYVRGCTESDADLVLLMDVLEHVDDDVGLLADYVGKVAPGTRFLITVPAFEFLWSRHDDFLEHRRRYRLGGVLKVAEAAGLKVDRATYYFAFIFPMVAAVRLFERLTSKGDELATGSDLTNHSAVVNGALETLCAIERPLLGINRLAGLSVFCLATKPAPA